MSAVLQVAPSGADLQIEAERWDTGAEHHGYIDRYGNRCERLTIPAGASRIVYEAEVALPLAGRPDRARARPRRRSWPCPTSTSRSSCRAASACRTSSATRRGSASASLAPGWERVQAIVDFVHGHLEWVAGASNPWTTAVDAYRAGQGVCRDFAHLAITFCRALNIPARYVFGYIPEIDVPPPAEPMDFAAWFEVYLDGEWHTFDARNNRRRVGRVVVGRGRDAVDVALITSFGPVTLTEFEVRAA